MMINIRDLKNKQTALGPIQRNKSKKYSIRKETKLMTEEESKKNIERIQQQLAKLNNKK